MITSAQLREQLGDVAEGSSSTEVVARSPGQQARHYAPRVPVVIVPGFAISRTLHGDDGLLSRSDPGGDASVVRIAMPDSAEEYAFRLFDALRRLDSAGVRRIVVEEPPHGPEWEAIHDRLRRAATPREKAKLL
jgi:L-threonylcarbamoyladenylate synthase